MIGYADSAGYSSKQILAWSWDQLRRAGDPHETLSILQAYFDDLPSACMHIAMLSWRYNYFNHYLEEP